MISRLLSSEEIDLTIIPLVYFNLSEQVAETEVIHYVDEAQAYMVEGRWSDLVSLLLTTADLIFANSAEKGP